MKITVIPRSRLMTGDDRRDLLEKKIVVRRTQDGRAVRRADTEVQASEREPR
jgi:hypothetical protein